MPFGISARGPLAPCTQAVEIGGHVFVADVLDRSGVGVFGRTVVAPHPVLRCGRVGLFGGIVGAIARIGSTGMTRSRKRVSRVVRNNEKGVHRLSSSS